MLWLGSIVWLVGGDAVVSGSIVWLVGGGECCG